MLFIRKTSPTGVVQEAFRLQGGWADGQLFFFPFYCIFAAAGLMEMGAVCTYAAGVGRKVLYMPHCTLEVRSNHTRP
jgi:hypothetical protein